ncbi:unnamed protein product [marine sediment metagenome]|uniref:Lipoprotein n=1 Tax=marine sediment metagenome TaxID=412755 RepID=X1N3Q2_9ZZZZ
MKRLSKYMALVMILLLSVVLMTGCYMDDKVTGGGRFESEDLKCTFGFNAQGEGWLCDGVEVKGQLQFNDHAGNKIHIAVATLEDVGNNTYKLTGIDKNAEEIMVWVTDNGQPGLDDGDYIKVKNVTQSKFWAGELVGGNIVIH